MAGLSSDFEFTSIVALDMREADRVAHRDEPMDSVNLNGALVMETASPTAPAGEVSGFVSDPTFEPDRPNNRDLFSPDEICQFDADDAEAGRRIAKILATLFVYTLFAMGIVGWWTFRVVQP